MSKFECMVQNHGMASDQDFSGASTMFTIWDDCETGVGSNTKEAYEDAKECAGQRYNILYKLLPSRPRGIAKRDKVPASYNKNNNNDCIHMYVTVYWKNLPVEK